jgi:DivIVA domain-containing protein
VTNERPTDRQGRAANRPTRRFAKRGNADERDKKLSDVRDVDFPIALRGYDRAAVDRYVQQVNTLIAELEISSSPESAVKHALEEVSEETRGILERAHETASGVTARSRAAADDRLQQAEREAAEAREAAARDAREARETARREAQELRETTERELQQLRGTAQRQVEQLQAEAQARVQKLDHHAETIRRERQRLINDVRALGQQLLETADAAVASIPPVAEPALPREASSGDDSVAEEQLPSVNKPPTPPPEQSKRV